MRFNLLFAICFAVLTMAGNLPAAQDAVPWAKTIEEAQQIAAQQNRLVLLHFWSYDCPPCIKLEENVFPKPEFGRAVAANYVPVKINAKDNPELARRYKVDRWPVDVIITPTGEQLTKPTVCPQDSNKYLSSLDQVAATYRVQVQPAVQVAQNQPSGYPERGVQYTQPVDPYAASRGAARPAPQQPNGQPAKPNAWAPSPTSAPPAGYAPATDPRAAVPANNGGYPTRGAEAQKGAYDVNGYPQRDPVNLKSAYRPELPSGSNAYVEGTPYRDPRGESARGSQYEAHPAAPGDVAMPPVEVGRPTQSEASSSVYGQPAKPANNPYATDLPRRDVRLNDNAAYGYGPPAQQPPAQQPRRDEPQPGFQSNPLANPGQGAVAEGRVDANRQPTGAPVVVAAENPPLAMEGYCSVGLIETGKWSKGDVRFGAIHRGRTYLFSSAADQQKFLANPDKYSPMLSGYDPVKYLEQGQLVDGKRQHGIFHEGHTYLFADEASLDRFCKQPQAFTNSVRQAMQQGATPNIRR